MIRNIFAILILALAIFSCTSKEKKDIKDFSEKDFGVENFQDESYCLIKAILKDDITNRIVVDFVKYYTGDKAVEMATKDGKAKKEIDEQGKEYFYLPNNYYIRNKTEELDTFTLAKDVEISVYEENSDNEKRKKLSIDNFSEQLKTNDLVKLTIDNGQIVSKIHAEYLPKK